MQNAWVVMPIAMGAFLATMMGGLFAISLRDRLHLVLGFSAGAVVMTAVSTYPLVAVFGPRARLAGLAVPGVLVAMRLYNLAFAHIGRTPQELMFNAYETLAAAVLIYFATSILARQRAAA